MTQLSDVNKIQHRMTLTKQTSKAFALELVGKPASTIQPLRTNDTVKPMVLLASSKSSMPMTHIRGVLSKSLDMRRKIMTAATATNETKHDIVFPNILTSIENEKVQFVISKSSMCNSGLLRNCQPPILSSTEKMNDVTFIEDHDITDADILSGRGGKSNHHIGNKRFRHLVTEMKTMYRNTGQRTDKTALSRGIIAYVHSYGGRFLIQDRTGNDRQWRVMTTIEARRKTLRETKVLKCIAIRYSIIPLYLCHVRFLMPHHIGKY